MKDAFEPANEATSEPKQILTVAGRVERKRENMLDAIVQLVRNALCCVKDLNLLNDTWLYDTDVTAQYYDFPEPMNKTTPLEAIISVAQFYVVWSGVPGSWTLFWTSYGKLKRIYRLIAATETATCDADRLINASLIREAKMALRSMFVGFNVLFISLAFVWMTANSWHLTETNIFGGIVGLIHALTVMNVGLVPLVYYMYKDAKEQFSRCARMKLLAIRLESGKATESDMGLTTVHALSGWQPFWDSGVGLFERVDEENETKLLAGEKVRLQQVLDDILGENAGKKDRSAEDVQKQKAAELRSIQRSTQLEGYREYFYFMANSIALYGYSACVVVYYWPDELQQPDWLRLGLLNLSNRDADWHGNFSGDLMWTIEPLVVLLSPMFIRSIGKKETKTKTD